jgi:hypothetical protein
MILMMMMLVMMMMMIKVTMMIVVMVIAAMVVGAKIMARIQFKQVLYSRASPLHHHQHCQHFTLVTLLFYTFVPLFLHCCYTATARTAESTSAENDSQTTCHL